MSTLLDETNACEELPRSDRLEYAEHRFRRDDRDSMAVTALFGDDYIAVSALFVRDGQRWGLRHITVDEDARGQGLAAELVAYYEARLGRFRAAWVSAAGMRFAGKYQKENGPRPEWVIGFAGSGELMLSRWVEE